jgi:predicted CxxxxCH...CXXCH cytochrome family protein
VNGVADVVPLTCTSCHGEEGRAHAAAPPTGAHGETATTSRAVGAHQRHLSGGSIGRPVACAECHPVPATTNHLDGTVQLASGAASFDGTTCTNACHGSAALGGSNPTPVWTQVDGSQAACGACHGLPPPASTGHPPSSGAADCARCHPATVTSGGAIDVAGGKHVNGEVETANLTCTTCHGDPLRAANAAAPPRGTQGETSTAARAVGAHDAHLRDSAVRAAIACAECHAVPSEPVHANGRADLVFGALASAGGQTPVWNAGAETCSSTWCHGRSGLGGGNVAPRWTRVDGSQAACGACHGLPPPTSSGHPELASGALELCVNCHRDTMRADGTLDLARGAHLNGRVEALDLTCTACHGDAARPAAIAPAPPQGAGGETATTTRAVGAHQRHVAGATLRAPLACGECHPPLPTSMGHANGTVDLAAGPLSRTGGASPAWDAGAATCSSTYCHGATLDAGGSDVAPVWTRVDGSQVGCGSCHGAPPPRETGHPLASSDLTTCAACHPRTVLADGTIDLSGVHLNGSVEVDNLTCSSCHGSVASAAPPRGSRGESATTTVAVGAHAAHVNAGPLHQAFACGECHVNPAATSHSDGVAQVAFGGLARTDGASPSWDRASESCAASYCHGATLGGGSNRQPIWTRADGTQAACGTCHGNPPPGFPHAFATTAASCARCHPATMNADGTLNVSGGRHVNGVTDVEPLGCTSCHGDAARSIGAAAPPAGAHGETATTARAVGAHQRHLQGGAIAGPMACTVCHVVPASNVHSNASVEVIAAAGWDGSTCTNACHGSALPGGSNRTPQWTRVDGTQAACGTCHALPPATFDHVGAGGVTDCARCHGAVVNADGTIKVAGGLHVNGVVNTTDVSCTSCHGDAARPASPAAPPRDTLNGTATTSRGVGAHQVHLTDGTLRDAIACSECHATPGSTSHADGAVQLAFGALARTGGAAPAWNGSSCSASYCHGQFTNGNTANAPTWTVVRPGTCGTCHGLPPAGTHPQNGAACASCHPGYTSTSVNPATHVNGTVNVSLGCSSCHGDLARAGQPGWAPPRSTTGQTAKTARAVGAHQEHLTAGTLANGFACAECHVVPVSNTHSNGAVTMTFGTRAKTGGLSPVFNGTTCSSTYCHGASLSGGSNRTPAWTTVNGTQDACGTCHGRPPSTGQHDRHDGLSCGKCHSGYTTSSVNKTLHINGTKDENASCHCGSWSGGGGW